MRTFLFLVCSAVFGFTPGKILSQNAKITINSNQTLTVDQVFKLIKSQTDYVFIYQANLFDSYPKVEVKKGVIKANDLLALSLGKGRFNFRFTDESTIVIDESPVKPQLVKIKGQVVDESGISIPGVNVVISRNKPNADGTFANVVRQASTDYDGSFSLDAETGYYIIISYMGHECYSEVVTSAKSFYKIQLKLETSKLNEVVIVGYGQTKRKDLTGSIASVSAKEIQQVKTQSIDNALAGRMSGVYVQGQGGGPGAGSMVTIRGMSAITGDNQPLYVVDGIPIVINPLFGNSTLASNRENPLLAINPDDVERVDVLKDASAAAIYGSRAANGVVLITTKRGKRNVKPQFTASVNTTIQTPIATYDVLNASQYKAFVSAGAAARIANGSSTALDDQIVNDPASFFGTQNTDWQRKSTNVAAMWYDYRVGFTGGTEHTNFLVSSNVTDQQGIFLGSKYNAYNLTMNIDSDITNSLKVGASINYSYTVNKTSGITNMESISTFRPDLGVYDQSGAYTSYPLYGILNVRNPVGGVGQDRNKRTGQNMYGTVYGEYKIIEGLKFKSQVNVGLTSSQTNNFSPSFNAISRVLNGGTLEASLYNQFSTGYTTVFSNTLSYIKAFGSHHIDAVLGVSWDRSKQELNSQEYLGFPDDYILTNIGNANRVNKFSSDAIESGLNSQFVRVNYNYKDLWLATFTARRDGSTKFGPNNQYGFFPSGAIAWNLHNEKFFQNKVVDKLKLKASVGRTGSDNLASFSYLAYFTSGNRYVDINGTAVNGIPNPDIRWEQTNQIDLGMEFGLFNNAIYGEVGYFQKNTSGIILYTPLPPETGFSTFNSNIADVSNKGWEISLGANIIRTKDFSWTSDLNISFIKNKVDNLHGGSYFSGGSNISGLVQGQPLGVLIGYQVIGIAQSQAQIDKLNSESSDGSYWASLQQPGDYIIKDVNGDGKITADDRVPLGSIVPDYYGGWSNTFRYKNFDLGLNFQFVKGNSREISNVMTRYLTNEDPYSNTTTTGAYNTWTPENTGAKYGRLGSPVDAGGNGYLSTFVEDASFIRVKSLSLGYNLPSQGLKKYGLSSLRFSVMGNNLLTFTKYSGLDPEAVSKVRPGTGVFDLTRDEGFSYPLVKTFTTSINVTF
ncbi:SusC/RagA family TonB-linked outer membrane protein [Flavobacterium sp. FlaQc-48]|uniref:SusC/RagA family TonB-linked outer membrane protein n=1 Tax=Flavobacterium sp. FlaQc-48 TaxID=3374181 RepID=UPI0037575F60